MPITPGHYTIHIPTKPYLAKYIAAKYGSPSIPLTSSNLFGVVVLSLLQKNVVVHMNLRKKHVRFRSFTDHLECTAPIRYMSDYGVDMTDDHVIHLNRYFESEFVETLSRHVQRSINPDARVKGFEAAIIDFIDEYGIDLETDITLDALKKLEYRHRKKTWN